MALGGFDEDALWATSFGTLFEGEDDADVEYKGVLVWKDPWHFEGWEFSQRFVTDWAWVLAGADDCIEASNRWRSTRGENLLLLP